MDAPTLALIGTLSIFIGILIGGIGIGGVLLVPMLTLVFGLSIHIAISVAMFSYIFSGLVGAILYARQRSINWNMAFWLFLGAIPAAFIGSFLSSIISAQGLEFFIAVLIILVGANAVMSGDQVSNNQRYLGKTTLVGLGAVTGIGSALSGTGGPLILVPILVWLKVPVLTAVGLSQAVLLPVATLATAGNLIFGNIDFSIGVTLALALMIGASIGARVAHSVSGTTLKNIVAWVLVVVGIFMVLRLTFDWVGT